MSWQIHIPDRVRKRIKKFPANDRGRIIIALREFELNPWNGDIVKLDEKSIWRRRVGNYLIIYCININAKLVEIKEIQRRTSSTY